MSVTDWKSPLLSFLTIFALSHKGKSSKSNEKISVSSSSSYKKKENKNRNIIFYFKDNTVLSVQSNEGIYNNRTLDMSFDGKVNASYEKSKLKAEKAVYSNSEGFLAISNNVIIDDMRGTMVADELLFDIKKQTLKIAAFKDNKINANIKLKWKKVLGF